MDRATSSELLDCFEFPDDVVAVAYADLTRIHRWLGDTACIVRALRGNAWPLERVLDIGCAHGGSIAEIQNALRAEVVGIDLRDHAGHLPGVKIIRADVDLSPVLRQMVKTHFSLNGELSHGLTQAVHAGV